MYKMNGTKNIDIDFINPTDKHPFANIERSVALGSNFSPALLSGKNSEDWYVCVKKFNVNAAILPFTCFYYDSSGDPDGWMDPWALVLKVEYQGNEQWAQVSFTDIYKYPDYYNLPEGFQLTHSVENFIADVNKTLKTLTDTVLGAPTVKPVCMIRYDHQSGRMKFLMDKTYETTMKIGSYTSKFCNTFQFNELYVIDTPRGKLPYFVYEWSDADDEMTFDGVAYRVKWSFDNQFTYLRWVQSIILSSNLGIEGTKIAVKNSNMLDIQNIVSEFYLKNDSFNNTFRTDLLYQPDPTNWTWFKLSSGQQIDSVIFHFYVRTTGYKKYNPTLGRWENVDNVVYPIPGGITPVTISMRLAHKSMVENS